MFLQIEKLLEERTLLLLSLISYADLQLGLPLTVSVAIHNIPEGMAISMPIFYGTQKKEKQLDMPLFPVFLNLWERF